MPTISQQDPDSYGRMEFLVYYIFTLSMLGVALFAYFLCLWIFG